MSDEQNTGESRVVIGDPLLRAVQNASKFEISVDRIGSSSRSNTGPNFICRFRFQFNFILEKCVLTQIISTKIASKNESLTLNASHLINPKQSLQD
jgi:hypothetical protein